MSENQGKTLFRQRAMERVASPEQLTDYLRVTNPGIWAVLAAVILLLAGLFAWSAVGTLETAVEARAVIRGHAAEIVPAGQGAEKMAAGMPVRIASREYRIVSVDTDAYGRTTARAEVLLPDGEYDAAIIVEQIQPLMFLLESR
ncbi:MAG: hypothetical protein IJ617_09190 [Oscillospiraceae bacterium]|nr:hypothetical protein [Oscillospiraceae bacterium]